MDWLNYHHLLYFWLVVREGGVARAAARLRLRHPTVSEQVRALEASLGEALLVKRGRRLELTEMGTVVYGYADEIFGLGQELLETVRGRPTGRPLRLLVGIVDVVPKLVAKRLLDPARRLVQPVRLVCREDKADRLIAELATHRSDVLLTDSPIPPGSGIRAFNHLLGDSGVTVFGRSDLAERYRAGFPASLDRAPMLLPTEAAAARRGLAQWFDSAGVVPVVEGEFDDSALLNAFGQDGAGLFFGPTAIENEVCRQYEVEVVGRLPEVRERFYAVSTERRVRNPAVAAICDGARSWMEGEGRPVARPSATP